MLRQLLLLLAIALSLLGCQNDSKDDLTVLLQQFELKPETQQFSADSVFEFVGSKGTRIRVNPNDLMAPSGKQIDSVEVRLLELTSLSDLVRNNAQTVSNGRWLVSGGSFEITLYSEDEMLELKPNRSIDVQLPKIRDEQMNLFIGERNEQGDMNWIPDTTSFQEQRYRGYVYYYDILVDTEKNRRYGIQSGYYKEIAKGDTLYQVTIDEFRTVAIERRADSVYQIQDTLYAINIVDESRYRELNGEATDGVVLTEIDVAFDRFYAEISVSKLGWINIDRFYPEITERARLELHKTDRDIAQQVFLLDPSQNTLVVLYPESDNLELYSESVPLNTPLTVLVFGHDGTDTYVFKQEVELQVDQEINIDLKKIDPEEIELYF
ncbi:MAG: hypothetical protein AAF466_03405 [Bacteroidota bacterium]